MPLWDNSHSPKHEMLCLLSRHRGLPSRMGSCRVLSQIRCIYTFYIRLHIGCCHSAERDICLRSSTQPALCCCPVSVWHLLPMVLIPVSMDGIRVFDHVGRYRTNISSIHCRERCDIPAVYLWYNSEVSMQAAYIRKGKGLPLRLPIEEGLLMLPACGMRCRK